MHQSTHDLLVGQDEVVKRFRSWDRDEAGREWAGLTLLHRHAAGLAPEPLRRERDPDCTPVIVMSRVTGEPLGSGPLSEDRTRALTASLNALHSAVPAGELADCGVSDPAYEVADVLEHVSVRLPGLVDPDALVTALAWPEGRVARLDAFRRLFAVLWLLRLRPRESAHDRNPPGSLERQAEWVRVLLGDVPEGRG